MAENSNLTLTIEAWADIVIKEWMKKIKALEIIDTSQLLNSFRHTIHTAADGDPRYILFAYEHYGKMIEYGVGNGVTLENRPEKSAAGLTKRKPKRWFSEVLKNELAVLRNLLLEKHALKVDRLFIENLDESKKRKSIIADYNTKYND